MTERMWFNNPRDKAVKSKFKCSKILNGYENIDINIFFSLKEIIELEDIRALH